MVAIQLFQFHKIVILHYIHRKGKGSDIPTAGKIVRAPNRFPTG